MRAARNRIRTLMIVVVFAGLESALASYALRNYASRLGADPMSAAVWLRASSFILSVNLIFALAILVLRHLWQFISRLFRSCDVATQGYRSSRMRNAL